MENEKFEIKDLSDVNSVMRTIKNIEDKRSEYKAFAEAEIKKVTEWLESMERNLDSKIDFYKYHLTEYLNKERLSNPRTRSISTPNGKFSCRVTKKISYPEEQMLEYLKANYQNLVKTVTVEKYDKNDIKKLLDGNINKETGEILEFVTIEENTTYNIKTTKDKKLEEEE